MARLGLGGNSRRWWNTTQFGLPATGRPSSMGAPNYNPASETFSRLNPGAAPSTGEYTSTAYPRDWQTGPTATPGNFKQIPFSRWLVDRLQGGLDWTPQKFGAPDTGSPTTRAFGAASAEAGLPAATGADQTRQMSATSFPWMVIPALAGLFMGNDESSAERGQAQRTEYQKQLLQTYGEPMLKRLMGGLEEFSPELVSRDMARWREDAETSANSVLSRARADAIGRGVESGSYLPSIQGAVATGLARESVDQQASLEQGYKDRLWQQMMGILSAVPGMSGAAGQAAAGFGNVADRQNQGDYQWWQSLAQILGQIESGGKKKTKEPPTVNPYTGAYVT